MNIQTDDKSAPVIAHPFYLSRTGLKRLGLTESNSTLLRWEADGRFPRRARLGGTRVAWLYDEVMEWLEEQSRKRQFHHYAEI
jgi:prophage regulatory protein